MLKHYNTLAISKKILDNTAINITLLLLLLYFVFHAIYGNLGLFSYLRLQKEVNQASQELNNLRVVRLTLENDAQFLDDHSLSQDVLEQYSRKILNVALPDEKIFVIK